MQETDRIMLFLYARMYVFVDLYKLCLPLRECKVNSACQICQLEGTEKQTGLNYGGQLLFS